MKDEAKDLFSVVTQLGKAMAIRSSTTFEESTTTLLQYSVLSFLQENNSSTMTEVSENILVSLSSTAQIIDRMEKSGHITRSQDTNDKRISRIKLTIEGEERLKKIDEEITDDIAGVLKNLSKQEVNELIRINKKLLEKLK